MIDELRSSTANSFLRPALVLVGCIVAAALVLLPFAFGKTGSGGMGGLAIAAAICLAAGLAAEGLAALFADKVSPLGVMLLGMAVRMIPPLGICLVLAAQGASGRQHLAFILYLLTMYLVTLALETWLTVKRVANGAPRWNQTALESNCPLSCKDG